GDVFVRDRISGTTRRVSVDSAGSQSGGSYDHLHASISADGRYVAFASYAADLVIGDTNGDADVFVHDQTTGVTERVSVSSSGVETDNYLHSSSPPRISGDGRYVVFVSQAANLTPFDTNEDLDVFVRDRVAGTTERVSVPSGGGQANGRSAFASISRDGRFVTFLSSADNLSPGWGTDVYVHDRQLRTTLRSSGANEGGVPDGGIETPSVSANGRYVAFLSYHTGLVSGDTNGITDVFVRDRQQGQGERANVATDGTQADGRDSYSSAISADGRFVAFSSDATNLVAGVQVRGTNVYVRDRGGNLPFSPVNLTALAVAPGAVQLTWTDTSTDETGFRIERDWGDGFFTIGQVGVNVTSYRDENVPGSAPVSYRVVARNDLGSSGFSNEATVRPLPSPPGAPADFRIEVLPSGVFRLQWTTVGDATSISIERKPIGAAFTQIMLLPGGASTVEDLRGAQRAGRELPVDRHAPGGLDVVSGPGAGRGPGPRLPRPRSQRPRRLGSGGGAHADPAVR
ncbi:MAG: hypothetical protein K0Q72_3048, partial [Armatimonadetes bacterium]|nr:hypothetical protein [Armatimonadota bacterium]